MRDDSSPTQRSKQSQTSQGVEGTEQGSKGFDPDWDGTVFLCRVWALGETPRLHQHDVLHSLRHKQRFQRSESARKHEDKHIETFLRIAQDCECKFQRIPFPVRLLVLIIKLVLNKPPA